MTKLILQVLLMIPILRETRAPDPDLFVNVEPRCPCVLLLDTSYSMIGRPISELNSGLKTFK